MLADMIAEWEKGTLSHRYRYQKEQQRNGLM